MKEYQKTMNAFLEGVCRKFNCMNALPALKEGFNVLCEANEKPIMEGTGAGYAFFPLDSKPFHEDPLFKKTMEYHDHPHIMKQRNEWLFKNGDWDADSNEVRDRSLSNLARHINQLLASRSGNDDVTVEYDDEKHECTVWYKTVCLGFIYPNHGMDEPPDDNYSTHLSGIRYASLIDFLDEVSPEEKENILYSFDPMNGPDAADVKAVFYGTDGQEDNNAGMDSVIEPEQCAWRIMRDVHRFKTEWKNDDLPYTSK